MHPNEHPNERDLVMHPVDSDVFDRWLPVVGCDTGLIVLRSVRGEWEISPADSGYTEARAYLCHYGDMAGGWSPPDRNIEVTAGTPEEPGRLLLTSGDRCVEAVAKNDFLWWVWQQSI